MGEYEKYYVCDTVSFAGVTCIGFFALMWEFQPFFITLLSIPVGSGAGASSRPQCFFKLIQIPYRDERS
jgi:hypothetical protein